MSILLFFILTICFNHINSQDIVACGGVVKTKFDFDFDFTKVSAKLFLSDGTLNYETDILPNGAFSIPVYDTGDYVLKVLGPNGWYFEPNEGYKISIDEKNICSNDFVFNFSGFSIFGKISTANIDMGPSGIEVNMYSNDNLVRSTKSVNGGDFALTNVIPGAYSISVNFGSLTELTHEKNSVFNIVVRSDNLIIKESFIIQGFPVVGDVNFDNEPMQNAQLFLFSKKKPLEYDYKKYKCDNFNDNEVLYESMHPFCKTVSDANGQFVFPILPGGKYVVLARYISSISEFDIKPTRYEFEVTSKPVNIKNIFKVSGFSVNGNVKGLDQKPILDAKIFIKKELKTSSLQNGSFKITGVKKGSHELSVLVDGFSFKKTTIKFDPKQPNIGTFMPSKITVCGSIMIDGSQPSERPIAELFRNLKVSLQDQASGKLIESVNVRTQEDSNKMAMEKNENNLEGSFCFYAQPGKYVVVPFMNPPVASFSLAPSRIKVDLVAHPVLIKFSQFRGKVFGSISCLEKCKTGEFEVTLKSSDDTIGAAHFTQHISVNMDDSQTGSFMFKNVDPGQYHLELISANSLEPVGARFCWSGTEQLTTLVDRDLDLGVVFSQTGYSLPVISSHTVDLSYYHLSEVHSNRSSDSKLDRELVDTLKLSSSSVVCLRQPGSYVFVASTCHRLENAETRVTTIAMPSGGLHFRVAKFRVVVQLAAANTADRSVISGYISYKDTDNSPMLEQMSWVADRTQLEYWALPDTAMRIVINSSVYLNTPEKIVFSVDRKTQQCETDVGTFYLEPGTFVTGKIEPGMKDVEVTVTQRSAASPSVVAMSDESGNFRVGPLNASFKYDVTPYKSEYKFVANEVDEEKPLSFLAYKLSELRVTVKNTESDKPIQGILLSIIGDTYRKNELTNENGTFSFIGLLSGKYYIRAMMKELEFEPNGAIEIELVEGSTEIVAIKAKRTSFSVFGKVIALSSESEPSITVEAERLLSEENKSNKCNSALHRNEYGVSDESGLFRIRGLIPGCSYSLLIKEKNNQDEFYRLRTFPNNIVINMKPEDVSDVKIIAIRDLHVQDVSAMVWTEDKFLNSLQLSVFPQDNPDNILTVHKFAVDSVFFQTSLPSVNKKTVFVVRMQSNLRPALFANITVQEHSIIVEPTTSSGSRSFHRHLDFHFRPTERSVADAEVVMTPSSLLLPFLIGLLSLLFYKKASLEPLLMQLFRCVSDHITGLVSSSSASTSSSHSGSTNVSAAADSNSSSASGADTGSSKMLDSKEISEINKAIAKPRPMVMQPTAKKIPFSQRSRKV